MPDDRSSIVLGNVSGPGVSASSFAVAAGTDWTVGPAQSSAADPFALGLRSLTVAEHGRLMLAWAVWLRNDSTVTVRGELSGVRHLTLGMGARLRWRVLVAGIAQATSFPFPPAAASASPAQ
mmetsp:Transcript_18168/g.68736  ORF Transcript_18168/g.68736 Transcript_18168/m.68736 type:complete len:122 (-) Transcript_18168:112-477(-)